MSVSIILPTYDESGNIIALVNKIIAEVSKSTMNYEVIVVDDNSPDKTAEICEKHFLKNRKVKTYIRRYDKGLARAILYGIKKSKKEFVVVMDTDFSHDPRLIPQMLKKIKSNDILIASRYAKKGGGENKARYLLSKIYNIFLWLLLNVPISDFLFGYFCIRRSFLIKYRLMNREIFSGFGDYFIRLSYKIYKSGGKFYEIPAYYKNRVYGVTKSNITKMFITYSFAAFKLKLTVN